MAGVIIFFFYCVTVRKTIASKIQKTVRVCVKSFETVRIERSTLLPPTRISVWGEVSVDGGLLRGHLSPEYVATLGQTGNNVVEFLFLYEPEFTLCALWGSI